MVIRTSMRRNNVFEQLTLWNPRDLHPQDSLPDSQELGAVYTRDETVDFILDLAGYLPSRPLQEGLSLTLMVP